MHFSAILVLIGAASVSAVNLAVRQAAPPACAAGCIANANTDTCAAVDAACLCKNEVFLNSTETCVFESCQGDDLQAALKYSQGICLTVGITLTSTPLAFRTSSGASVPSNTAAAASTTASTTAPAASGTSPSTSPAASSPAASQNAASFLSVNAMLAGVATIGLAALAL